MRKYLFSLIFVFSIALLASADQSYFLIIKTGNDITKVSKNLQSKGIAIQQSVPPAILVVKAPVGINFSDIPSINGVFSSVVPIKELKPFGPLGVAAGVEWNREIKKAQTGPSATISPQEISKVTLAAPENVSSHLEGSFLSASWDDVPGILLYEVELRSGKTGDLLAHTKTDKLSTLLAVAEGNDTNNYFLRIRACERPDSLDPAQDTVGEWSSNISVEIPPDSKSNSGPAPTPSSPVEGYETSGLLVNIEWTHPSAHGFHLQVSPDPSFQTTLIDVGVKGEEFIVPSSALHVGDHLYWRLQAWEDIKSDWTQPRQIRIGAPRPIDSDLMVNPEAPR